MNKLRGVHPSGNVKKDVKKDEWTDNNGLWNGSRKRERAIGTLGEIARWMRCGAQTGKHTDRQRP